MSNKLKIVLLCLALLFIANLLMAKDYKTNITYEGFFNFALNDTNISSFHPGLHRETVNTMIEQFENQNAEYKEAANSLARAKDSEGSRIQPIINEMAQVENSINVAVRSNDENELREAQTRKLELNNQINIAQIESRSQMEVANANMRAAQMKSTIVDTTN
jgi:mevalonate kinase